MISGVTDERVCALELETVGCITCNKLKSPERSEDWTEAAEMDHQKTMDKTNLSCVEQAHQVLTKVFGIAGWEKYWQN